MWVWHAVTPIAPSICPSGLLHVFNPCLSRFELTNGARMWALPSTSHFSPFSLTPPPPSYGSPSLPSLLLPFISSFSLSSHPYLLEDLFHEPQLPWYLRQHHVCHSHAVLWQLCFCQYHLPDLKEASDVCVYGVWCMWVCGTRGSVLWVFLWCMCVWCMCMCVSAT